MLGETTVHLLMYPLWKVLVWLLVCGLFTTYTVSEKSGKTPSPIHVKHKSIWGNYVTPSTKNTKTAVFVVEKDHSNGPDRKLGIFSNIVWLRVGLIPVQSSFTFQLEYTDPNKKKM